jgi:RNA polymerase sigma factor (TIGR02999 family)
LSGDEVARDDPEGESAARAGQVTRVLHELRGGDRDAMDRLLPLVYDELRRIAARQLRRGANNVTVQPTMLVHEAYMKLIGPSHVEWQDRAHFLGVAARAMRQVLIDYARRRLAGKRGGGWARTTLSDDQIGSEMPLDELISLDTALEKLGALDERLRRVVECRFFAGMSEDEIAEALGISSRTVRRDWLKARAWLHGELYPESSG